MTTFIVDIGVGHGPQANACRGRGIMRGTQRKKNLKPSLTLTLSLTLLALAFTPSPAGADFHGVCTGIVTGFADVDLELGESQDPYQADPFLYSGLVACPDAVVTITSLRLYLISGEEPVLVAETEGEACDAELDDPCSLQDVATSYPGEYEVRMRFDADDPDTPHTDFQDVPRRATFLYLGYGEPLRTCTSTGTQPIYLPPGC